MTRGYVLRLVSSADRLMQFICVAASRHNGTTSTPRRGCHSSPPLVLLNRRETHGPNRLEDA